MNNDREVIKIVIATPFKRYDDLVSKLELNEGIQIYRIYEPTQLNVEELNLFNPRFIFFPHWSWKIPSEIYTKFECVIFHMTDLPYGRGGSPLQNLIVRGINETMISAITCVNEIDAGSIYLKSRLSLYGSAEEILLRAANVIKEMIEFIVYKQPVPQVQIGDVVNFKRRVPSDSNLISIGNLEVVFDYIRMLDAEGYPKAFVEVGDFKFEFSRASLKQDEIIADVRITKLKDKNE
jgi:methionyl-tRNA formyltransferase